MTVHALCEIHKVGHDPFVYRRLARTFLDGSYMSVLENIGNISSNVQGTKFLELNRNVFIFSLDKL